MSKNKSLIHTYGEFYNLLESSQRQKQIENDFTNFSNLSLLALERFTWNNLPCSLTSEIIEKEIQKGMAFFTYTQKYGFICMNCIATDWDIYNEPTRVKVIGRNYSQEFDVSEGVLIKDNAFNISSIFIVDKYTKLLNDFDITIQTNILQQRIPLLIPTTSNNKLTNEIILDKSGNAVPYLLIDKEQAEGFKEPIQTKIPFIVDDVQEAKLKIYKECLSKLGIGNANTEKKERLIEKEVESNEDEIGMQLEVYYKYRRNAVKQIRLKYPELNNIECLITKDIIRPLEKGE